jgi:hypothetical protein
VLDPELGLIVDSETALVFVGADQEEIFSEGYHMAAFDGHEVRRVRPDNGMDGEWFLG